jgi:hypothetical protein
VDSFTHKTCIKKFKVIERIQRRLLDTLVSKWWIDECMKFQQYNKHSIANVFLPVLNIKAKAKAKAK